MAVVQADPDRFCPGLYAYFEKTHGAPGTLAVGDEFFVHIRSPWDGPVRVSEVSPRHFRLVTLAGHLECGTIRFSARARPEGGLIFEIQSCARSRDAIVDLGYDVLGALRLAQGKMWAQFAQHVSAYAGGDPACDVEVRTFQADYDDPLTPRDAREVEPYSGLLASIAARALNFESVDPAHLPDGWNRDDDEAELVPEPPGPPRADGSWARACAFVRAYRFPDPRRLQGLYDPDADLEGRPMLLRARFLGVGFRFGVRVHGAFDEVRAGHADGPVHAWGYSYRTTEGHFERGQITFEVLKYARTGRVVFRMHSYSQRGHIANPLFRLGFYLFGRALQRQFVARALARTQRFVEESLVRDACLKQDAQALRLLTGDWTDEAQEAAPQVS